jgi:hypothetical protein
MLGSLLGDTVINSMAGAVSRYSGLDVATTKKMLAFVMPLILAKVGAAWKGRGGTTSALQGLFADQKNNIVDAVPTGFSLADIPGVPSTAAAVRMVDRTASPASSATRHEAAARSSASWLLPLAAVLLAALGLWYFFGRTPEAPDVARNAANTPAKAPESVTALKPAIPDLPAVPDLAALTEDVAGVFTSANQALANIGDAAAAQAAVPKLTELSARIDGVRDLADKLPAASQTALGKLVAEQLAPLKEQAAKVLATLGADATTVKPVLDEIVNKLSGLATHPESKT